MSVRDAARSFGRSLVTAASSAPMGRADAPLRRLRGRDDSDTVVVYCGARMRLSLVRLVATLLFSGQMLPVGLPLLCDQVQRRTSANCDQPMSSHPSGPVVDPTTGATQCVNSAFCATTATAVVAPSGAG